MEELLNILERKDREREEVEVILCGRIMELEKTAVKRVEMVDESVCTDGPVTCDVASMTDKIVGGETDSHEAPPAD